MKSKETLNILGITRQTLTKYVKNGTIRVTEEHGINVISNEESYTSKCDALALEEVRKHDTYLGKRVKRGLFRSSIGKTINADVNGAINILRKVVPNLLSDGIEGVGLHPIIINL